MNKDYVIVKFDGNYADEFDVTSTSLVMRHEWDEYVRRLELCEDELRDIGYYFGTNESLRFDSPSDFLSQCKVIDIPDDVPLEFVKGLCNDNIDIWFLEEYDCMYELNE